MTAPQSTDLSASAWEQRYQEGRTAWDLGQPAPALQQWINRQSHHSQASAIVLGAGRGYDALLFAHQGFQVTAVDFAPSAIAALEQQAQAAHLLLSLRQQDIFTLVPELAGQFQYVVEHTCFCALDPNLRSAYVQLAADLLTPKGELVGVFFTHRRPGGPPFGITPEELASILPSLLQGTRNGTGHRFDSSPERRRTFSQAPALLKRSEPGQGGLSIYSG